jgi:hypothetical protein
MAPNEKISHIVTPKALWRMLGKGDYIGDLGDCIGDSMSTL